MTPVVPLFPPRPAERTPCRTGLPRGLWALLLVLASVPGASVARGAAGRGLDADGLESRSGKFDAEYPLPPAHETARLVQLLAKRRGANAVTPATREELWFRGRNVERQEPAAGAPAGRGKPPEPTKPAGPPPRREEHAGDPPGYQFYVPQSYRPGKLYGVIVYASPGPRGDIPRDYQELCDRHALIWIAPANVGNNRYAPWRRYMALEAAWQAARRFTIDTQRLYVCGTSGGGRVASNAALLAPETFTGGFYLIGCNYFRNLPRPDQPKKFYPGFWPNADAKVLERAKKQSRFVLLTGSEDFNRQNTKVVYDEGYAKDGFAHATYLEVPGMGHTLPPAEWFEKGLEFLDSPLPKPADLHQRAVKLEQVGELGEAALDYARAAARAGEAEWAADAQAKADAVYTDYRKRVAGIRKHLDSLPADKAARERAAAAVRDLQTHFGPMADRDADEFEAALLYKPPATRPARPR